MKEDFLQFMDTIKRIAKNTGIVLIGNNITKIFTFILTIFLARYLGDKGFGVLSFALAFTGLFIILIDMGLQRLILREIARDKERAGKYVGNSLIMKLGLSIIVFALIAVIINLMNYPLTSVYAVYIGAVIIIIQSFSETFQSAFQAFERMEYSVIPKIIRVLLRLSLTIPLLLMGFKVIAVLLAYLFVMFVNLIINYFFYTKKIGRIDFRFDKKFSKSLLKRSLPFAIATVFIIIYFKIDITMLSIMKGDAVVGWYSAAYHLLESLHFLPLAFTTAIFPIAARYFIENKQKLILLYEEAMRYMFYLAIPIAVGTTLIAPKIIPLIYGGEFLNSIKALQVLIWVVIPTFTTYVLGLVMVSINKEVLGMYTNLAAAIINVTLNLILIPRLSYIGASIATVACETILFIIDYIIISKFLATINLFKITYKPIFASAVMGIVLFYLNFLNVFIMILIGGIVYFGIMYFTKAISVEDKERILKLIKRKRVV